MSTVKNAMLEEADRAYTLNRLNHEATKLRERIRRYAHAPEFVAKLNQELEAVLAERKAFREAVRAGKR